MEQQGIMRQLPTDDQTIVDYLYRIAGEYGEKAAVLMGDAALSYHDLNARSNQLAHYLRGLGIGEDRVVAIRLPRGMARRRQGQLARPGLRPPVPCGRA